MNNMFSKSAIWVVVALLLFMLFKQFDNHSVAGGAARPSLIPSCSMTSKAIASRMW